jgi:hypothetical protein
VKILTALSLRTPLSASINRDGIQGRVTDQQRAIIHGLDLAVASTYNSFYEATQTINIDDSW